MNIKANAAFTILIIVAVCIIAIFVVTGFNSFSFLLAAAVLVFAFGEFALIYFMKRQVISRKQNIFVIISIALMGLVFIVAIADYNFGTNSLPPWCVILGIVIFFFGNYLFMSSLLASPPHSEVEYGEKAENKNLTSSTHGPYDVIRHPVDLASISLAFALPLMLGSAWALIASGAATIFIIIHAVTIENYRFENYEWYYDYTKKVPYMLIPVIW